jgi:hypothetical protein
LNVNYTYQQKDSIKKHQIDSAPKSNSLLLLDVEDESVLLIPSKKKKKVNQIVIKQEEQIDTSQTVIDTSLYNKGFDNIPTRKAVTTTVTSKDTEKNTFLYQPEVNNRINTSWQTILLLLAFGILGFVKAFNSNRFNQIIKSIYSIHAAQEVAREERVFFHRVSLSLLFVYVIGLTLLIASIYIYQLSTIINEWFYLKIALFIVVVYAVKFSTTYLLSVIFSRADLSVTYTYNTLIYNYLFGIVLLPCLAFIYYSSLPFLSILNYVILPFFVFTLLLRMLRMIMIGKQNNFFVLYIILYICTLEIIPLVVLGKFFIFK